MCPSCYKGTTCIISCIFYKNSFQQAHPNPSGNWSEWILSTLRLPNIMAEEVPNRPLDYYTCPFKTSKLDKFLGSNDPNTFFSRAQRSRMVYEILATTPFGKEKKGEVGIERMVEEGAYSAAFPLHDAFILAGCSLLPLSVSSSSSMASLL